MNPLPYQSKFHIASLEALNSFAQRLSTWLRPADVVALDGNLGAGKTTLTQKIGQALGLKESVASPTFVLMNEYLSGKYPIVHVDLYRLGEERSDSLAEELFSVIDEGRSLVLVEWACYGAFLNSVLSVSIRIEPLADSVEGRLITLNTNRPLSNELVQLSGSVGNL